MKFALLCKRFYTNKDLVADRFGRLYHLPFQLTKNGCKGIVCAADYRNDKDHISSIDSLVINSLSFKIYNPVSYFYKSWKAMERFHPDIIIGSGDTHFGFTGLMYAQKLKLPFVFDVYDDYRVFGTNKIPGIKALFQYTVKNADLVVCASKPLMEKISSINRSVIVIENGVDTNLFRPYSLSDARKRLGIKPDETVIGYFGYVGKQRGMLPLFDALEKILKNHPKIRLLLAGRKDPSITFEKPFIDYRGEVSQEEIPFFISASNVVVIPYLSNPQVDVSNPCKIAEYLACEVPVVTTRVTDIAETFSQIPEAICEPGNVEDMVRAITWQLQHKKTIVLPGGLRWDALGKKLSAAFERIIFNKNI